MGQKPSSTSSPDATSKSPRQPTPEDLKQRLHATPHILWTYREIMDWMKLEVGIDAAFVDWIQPILVNYQYDAECLEELGLKFLRRKAKELAKSTPPPVEIRAVFRTLKEARAKFIEEIEEARRKAIEIDEMAGSKRKFDPRPEPNPTDPHEMIIYYHKESRNMSDRGARALDRNWANQSKCHRRWMGSRCFELPIAGKSADISSGIKYAELFEKNNSIKSRSLSVDSLSAFFYHALACTGRKDTYQILTAPKSSWSKRVNASSGGLHPVESYVFMPPSLSKELSEDLSGNAALLHYSPQFHGLELCRSIPADIWADLETELDLVDGSFLVAITSVNWREIWKYGERAFRYSQLDIGHGVGSILLSCLMLGWQARAINLGSHLGGISDETFATLLGFHTTPFTAGEEEKPAVLLCITPSKDVDLKNIGKAGLSTTELIQKISEIPTSGIPNQQSWTHFEWDLIKGVDLATVHERPETPLSEKKAGKRIVYSGRSDAAAKRSDSRSAAELIRTRRSALDFNSLEGKNSISLEQFYEILIQCVPALNPAFWAPLEPWGISSHFVIYAAHVTGLPPGIYVLVRDKRRLKSLIESSETRWMKVSDAPKDLELYLVKKGESEEQMAKLSQSVSCQQGIALHCAFSLGMFVPNFEKQVKQSAPSSYRMWHWEAGAVGQLLYLEAESHGLKATGMGCFTDEVTLKNLGHLEQGASLYHFSIGVALPGEDRYQPYAYETSFGRLAAQELEESKQQQQQQKKPK